jgi:hypothetical protein
MLLAHAGEFHPLQLIVLLGALVVPAAGILIAALVAGHRGVGEEPTGREARGGGGKGRSVPGAGG